MPSWNELVDAIQALHLVTIGCEKGPASKIFHSDMDRMYVKNWVQPQIQFPGSQPRAHSLPPASFKLRSLRSAPRRRSPHPLEEFPELAVPNVDPVAALFEVQMADANVHTATARHARQLGSSNDSDAR